MEKKPNHIKMKKNKKTRTEESSKKNPVFLRVLFLGVALLGVLGLYVVNSGPPTPAAKKQTTTPVTPENKKVTRFMQDSQKKAELQNLKVEVENLRVKPDDLPAFMPLEGESVETRPLGVELSPDPSIEQVYSDLNSVKSDQFQTPEERISARIAEKKWLHEYKKMERKTYIQNFIEAARLAGYDIKIDDNLVVTEVRPLNNRPKVPLDKVLENLGP